MKKMYLFKFIVSMVTQIFTFKHTVQSYRAHQASCGPSIGQAVKSLGHVTKVAAMPIYVRSTSNIAWNKKQQQKKTKQKKKKTKKKTTTTIYY